MITGAEKIQEAVNHGRRMSTRSLNMSDVKKLKQDSSEFVDAMIDGTETLQKSINKNRRR